MISMYIELFMLAAGCAEAVIAGVFDYKTKKIPNWLTLIAAFIGFGLSFFFPFSELILKLIVGVCWFFLWVFGLIGGGDAKLLIGINFLIGALESFLITIVSAILFLVVQFIKNRKETKNGLRSSFYSIYTRQIPKLDKQANKTFAFAPYLAVVTGIIAIGKAVLLFV